MGELTEAYASVDDLEARWHSLTESEKTTAKTLLLDASQYLLDEGVNPDKISKATLKRVVCNMVKRSMTVSASGVPDGVSQTSMAAGPFNQSFTFANSDGALYLLRAERKQLGLLGQRAFHILMGDSS